jgi:hypothetical protein
VVNWGVKGGRDGRAVVIGVNGVNRDKGKFNRETSPIVLPIPSNCLKCDLF